MAITVKSFNRTHGGLGPNMIFSYSPAITEGNLLVVATWHTENADLESAPAGWIRSATIKETITVDQRLSIWTKIAGAGEDVNPSFSNGEISQRVMGMAWEFAGAQALDVGGADESTYVHGFTTDAVTSLQVDTTKAFADDQLVLAIMAITNTFTEPGTFDEGLTNQDDYSANSRGLISAWSQDEQTIQPTATWTTSARSGICACFGIGADPSGGGDSPFAAADAAAADIVAADIAAADIVAL